MKLHLTLVLLVSTLLGPIAHGNEASSSIPATGSSAATCLGQPLQYDPQLAQQLVNDTLRSGNAQRGMDLFCSTKLACLSCHRVGDTGGSIGPALTQISTRATVREIAESILWPSRRVSPEFNAWLITTSEGKTHQCYKRAENQNSIQLFDIAAQQEMEVQKSEIEDARELGSVMPEGLAGMITPAERADLLRFLLDLGTHPDLVESVQHRLEVAAFPYSREPLRAEDWPNWQAPVNRDRYYDFYEKVAAFFGQQRRVPRLLPAFPGVDGGQFGHWGNQNDTNWADNRWNEMDLGSVMAGVFVGPNGTVPKAVCARLGDEGAMSVCFNPQTLRYECLWRGGFVQFSSVRHGFLDGIRPAGEVLALPDREPPPQSFKYHGYYRYGKRIVFAYRAGDVEILDSPWVERGQFVRTVAPIQQHPMKAVLAGGPPQWPQSLEVHGQLGAGHPYAIDTIPLPFDNPWKALIFCGDHAFLSNQSALVCTMQGDVWRVTGIDDKLENLTWRRFAAGLHHALGMVVHHDAIYVLGRDQITRLRDLNQDGEADYYECVSNAMLTSPAGHDFICGLARDADGNFYTASGNQGLIRIDSTGDHVEVLAAGLRNPDGIHLMPDGSLTAPASEGEWTPTSMIFMAPSPKSGVAAIPIDFGYGGPKNGKLPALPLVYLPRGLDHSSGAQVTVPDNRWGPLNGQLIHLSYGDARLFLILRDTVDGQVQGAAVPLPGDFRSGIHRGSFNPGDGQLYVSGMAGWGTYALDDGCFQRVRYTGERFQVPDSFHVHENGILVRFVEIIDPKRAADVRNHFAQAWNYRYSQAYGSPEFSPRNHGLVAHDMLNISAVHLVDDRTLFLEIPDLQPVNVMQLSLAVDDGPAQQLFVTIHKLDRPYSGLPGYQPTSKTIAPHPLLQDVMSLRPAAPNPWQKPIDKSRPIAIETGKNLSFAPRTFTASPGEAIQFTLKNSDVVPHNWILIAPGQLSSVGSQANRLVADPDAVTRQYVPQIDDVLTYTNVVAPGQSYSIYFQAPQKPGRYPFLCTYPGHWMVMNGELLIE